MDSDTLIHYGGEIKNIQESEAGWKFGGYLVVFDSTDVSSLRDRFTKSTDFDIQDGDRRSVYYNHGMDGTVKRTRIGDCHVQVKDAGIWIEGEIKKRSDYLAKHAEQIAMNIKQFGLSSGAPAHLVERKDVEGGHEVTLWPIAEASITPTPAEPMTGCVSLKSLMEPEADAAEDETKNEIITAPTSTPPDGMEFEAHSKSVLAAVGDIQERIEGLTELRCVKSERRWSEAKYAQLTQLADGLASSAEAIKVLAETHAPLSQEPSTETDTPDDLQALTLQTLWDYQVTCARLHGVAV